MSSTTCPRSSSGPVLFWVAVAVQDAKFLAYAILLNRVSRKSLTPSYRPAGAAPRARFAGISCYGPDV